MFQRWLSRTSVSSLFRFSLSSWTIKWISLYIKGVLMEPENVKVIFQVLINNKFKPKVPYYHPILLKWNLLYSNQPPYHKGLLRLFDKYFNCTTCIILYDLIYLYSLDFRPVVSSKMSMPRSCSKVTWLTWRSLFDTKVSD